MNHYIMIRRLRWPAILLLVGVVELLHQTGVISHFWHMFWPLLLILIGVLLLAERAALASEEEEFYPGQPYPGAVNPAAATGTSIVPAHTEDFGKDSEGGQL
jgi:hypothetical protein